MHEQLRTWWQRSWRDLAGVGSVVALACAYLSPALKDGGRFGSFDFVIPLTSLGRGTYAKPPFNHLNSDVVSQMAAWNLLDWRSIHAGHFPLWNPYSLLGVPHFLNFESAVLSLPDIVSYAVPAAYAFLVVVLVKLLIAGTGAYALARALGLRPFAASFAGIAFMLSGPFANWLTWPLSDTVAWAGWIAAFAVWSWRRPDRVRYGVGLAASVAFCLYGGFPEGNVFVLVLLGVIVIVLGLAWLVARAGAGWRAGARRAGAVLLSVVAGGLLAMPLWWPGMQILKLAHRQTEGRFPALPPKALSLLVAQGYYGLPTRSNPFFLKGWNYYESVSYVGVIALALAVPAIVRWWRRPVVLALAVACLAVLAVVYEPRSFHPLQDFLNSVAGQVQWERLRTVLGLPLGLLAGLGLSTLSSRQSRASLWSFGGAVLVLGAGVGIMAASPVGGTAATTVRARSLIWPAALVVLCVLCALWWLASERLSDRLSGRAGALHQQGQQRRRGSEALRRAPAGALWAGSAAFLLFAGVGINSYSHAFFPTTAAISTLQHTVGSAIVGTDTGNASAVQVFVPVGFYPNVNIAYRVTEFVGHDPVLPQKYFTTFAPETAKGGPGYFQPDIHSAAEARRYGISFVLVSFGLPPLPGGRLVTTVAGQRLYAVPGASRFTLSGGGRVRSQRSPAPGEYDVVTSSSAAGTLTARVTDVPGWHATIDGKPVSLEPTGGVMWSLHVPAGSHRVRLWYWPERLTQGLVMAGGGVVLLVAWFVGTVVVRRRRKRSRGWSRSRRAVAVAGAASESAVAP